MKKLVRKVVLTLVNYILLELRLAPKEIRAAVRASREETLEQVLRSAAKQRSADFFHNEMQGSLVFSSKQSLRHHAIRLVKEGSTPQKTEGGTVLEFGVLDGESLRLWASSLGSEWKIFGFDTFTGLTEDFAGTWMPRGAMEVAELPVVPSNVTLVKGDVRETLGQILQKVSMKNVRFVHLDMDLYAPTKFVLESLVSQLEPGTLILFDEFFGYPLWEFGEFRALNEVQLGHRFVGISAGDVGLGAEACLIEVV